MYHNTHKVRPRMSKQAKTKLLKYMIKAKRNKMKRKKKNLSMIKVLFKAKLWYQQHHYQQHQLLQSNQLLNRNQV